MKTMTPAEEEVTRLKCQGLLHKEIAFQLHRSEATIRTHLQHIHAKLDVHNSVELKIKYDNLKSQNHDTEKFSF